MSASANMTRHEALEALDPARSGAIEVHALPVGPVEATAWRGVVKLAALAPPGAARRRGPAWVTVAEAHGTTAGEAIAAAVAAFRRGAS